MRIASIKSIPVEFFSLMKELYSFLNSSKIYSNLTQSEIKEYLNKAVTLQREIFNLKVGSLEQIGIYLLHVIKEERVKEIIIEDIDDLLEYIVYKTLDLSVSYKVNLSEFIERMNEINDTTMVEFNEGIKMLSVNVSRSGIINLIEVMNKFYFPNKISVIKTIIGTFICLYDNSVSNKIDLTPYSQMLTGSINTFIIDSVNTIIEEVNCKFNREIFNNSIFSTFDTIEFFMEGLTRRKETELEKIFQMLEEGNQFNIEKERIDHIYQNLLKMSEMISKTNNEELISLFQDHTELVDKCFKKK